MRARKHRPNLDMRYSVLRCKIGETSVGLGIIGTVWIGSRPRLAFAATREVPPEVPGLDNVGKTLLAAVPESVHSDLLEVTRAATITTDPLDEIAKRYRGTIFADALKKRLLRIRPEQPLQLHSQILKAVTDLYTIEVLERSQSRKRSRRTRAKRKESSPGALHLPPAWMIPAIETRAVTQFV